MRVLVIKKYQYNKSCFIERQLPAKGDISVSVGDKVRSFDKIGHCVDSEDSGDIRLEGTFLKKQGEKVYANEVLWVKKRGFVKVKEGKAPFSGVITNFNEKNGTYRLRRNPKDYDLIAGASGVIKDIVEGKSVLISTPALKIYGVAGKGEDVFGELMMLGRHNEELDEVSDIELTGKIVVCGILNNYLYSKAKFFGAVGFVTGSITYSLYKDLLDKPSIIVANAFGHIPFDPLLFDYLNSVTSRFVILRPGIFEMVIPESNQMKWAYDSGIDSPMYTDVKEGQIVQVFTHSYFGRTGSVVGTELNRVKVQVWGEDKVLSLNPNSLAVIANNL